MAGGGGQTTNAFQGSANSLGAAARGANGAMMQSATLAGQAQPVQAQQVGGAGLGQYMNPFQQQVIDSSVGTMDRARQMTMNGVGAQATDAGAFGGSRHGVADSLTNEAFMRESGNMAAGLNAQNYGQAMGYAGQDADRTNAANMANQQAGLTARGQQLSSAGLLGQLGGQMFDTGRAINGDMQQQGVMQQAMMQQLIDAAKGQFAGYTGSPTQSLQAPLAAIGGVPQPQTTTQTKQPGLMDYLSLGAAW